MTSKEFKYPSAYPVKIYILRVILNNYLKTHQGSSVKL